MSFAPKASHNASASRVSHSSGRGYAGFARRKSRIAEVGEGNLFVSNRMDRALAERTVI